MSLKFTPRRGALAAAIGAALSPALSLAQSGSTAVQAVPRSALTTPTEVLVTGNPLRSAATATPSNVLSGDGLVLRRGSTLGETLDGLPGLSSSYFGPNANRPMIRGQDGDRIRMLSNSGVPLDASALSYDHAVPIDPLVIERIEVLRGPAALLYGGGAIGGVVNTIDNRIPKAAIDGVGGAAELRYGGPATERGAGALVETGGNGFAVHADGFWRQTDDMKVPCYQRPTEGVGLVPQTTILNSASKSYGGAVGGSMVWDKGYLGASVDTFRSDYGTVAEENVTIDMYLNKLTFAGEVRDLDGFVSAVSGQWLVSDYQHQEIESGAVATTFKNKGSDLRLQAEHRKFDLGGGKLAGVFGLQTENADFSALGDEAFVPSTTTRQFARVRAGGAELGRQHHAQLRRPRRACKGGFGRRRRWPDAVRPSAVAIVHALQRSRRRHPQPDAAVAGQRQPGLHRTRAQLLRAVCQRAAHRHRRLRSRQPEHGHGKGHEPGRRRAMEGRPQS